MDTKENATRLAPGVPKTVEPGAAITIAVSFTPKMCASLPAVLNLLFSTHPPPFIPDPPPPPAVAPPGYVPSQWDHNSPGALDFRNMENYRMDQQFKLSQWTLAHPMRSFCIAAKVLPGVHETERVFLGILTLLPYSPGEPIEYATLYAGTYQLANPFKAAYSHNGEQIIYDLSPEAEKEVESYAITLAHDYQPQIPPPVVIPIETVNINTVDISTDDRSKER